MSDQSHNHGWPGQQYHYSYASSTNQTAQAGPPLVATSPFTAPNTAPAAPQGQQPLTPSQIAYLRDAYYTNLKLRTQAILSSPTCTSATRAEYTLLNLLEILFGAFKSLVRMYARLGLGYEGIHAENLGYSTLR